MERSEHLKLQRLLDHEKAAAAAAKAREKEARHALREMGGDGSAGGGGGAELRASGSEVGGGGGGASSTKASGEVQAAQAAQQDAQERESQLKTKLAHAANESARARDKLRAMQDSLRVKQREWDKDRTNLQRQAHAPPPPPPPPPPPLRALLCALLSSPRPLSGRGRSPAPAVPTLPPPHPLPRSRPHSFPRTHPHHFPRSRHRPAPPRPRRWTTCRRTSPSGSSGWAKPRISSPSTRSDLDPVGREARRASESSGHWQGTRARQRLEAVRMNRANAGPLHSVG